MKKISIFLNKMIILVVLATFGVSANAQYCNTTYATGCSVGDQIENFSTTLGFTNITNNLSGCSAGPSYATYYPNMIVTVVEGNSFDFSVQSGTAFGQGFGIWVDWNDDDDYDDPGEDVWNSVTSATTPFTGTISTSIGQIGLHRMRVKCNFNGIPLGPCVAQTWGEEEDYNVNVLPNIISSYPYCQDFESGAQGWTSAGTNNEWELGTPTNTIINAGASGGTESWVTDLDGDYPTNSESWVIGPEFDLTGVNNPHVSMNVWWESEFSWDGANLESSIDNGASWQTIGTASSGGTNWYTDGSVNGLSFSGSDDGWTGRNGTGSTGGSNGWVVSQHALAGLSGQSSVFFRVAFGSDGSVVDEGFGFDDICVGELNDVGIAAIIVPDSTCGVTSDSVWVVVKNFGLEDQSNFTINLDSNGSFAASFMYTNTLSVAQTDTVLALTFNSTAGGVYDYDSWTVLTGDDNGTNDMAQIDSIDVFGLPVGTISGGGAICADGITTVNIDVSGSASPWVIGYDDGTSQTFVSGINASPYVVTTNTAGVYTIVNIIDSVGCQGIVFIDSAVVIVNPLPVIDLGPDTTICGDAVLDPGTFVSYLWQDSSTAQTFLADMNATYSVTVTDGNGCTGSDDVNLNANPLPVVNLGADTSFCEGSTVTLNAGAGFLNYSWSTLETGQIISVSTLGVYTVTVTAFNGCSGEDEIEVLAENPNPVVNLGPDVNVHPDNLPHTFDAGAGFADYLWNEGTITQTLDAPFAGTYSVVVTDDNGCIGGDTVVLGVYPNGISELNAGTIKFYPNPTNGFLNIELEGLEGNELDVTVTDLQGKVMLRENWSNLSQNTLNQLNLADFAQGFYLVRLSNEAGSVVQKISVQ